MDNNEIAEIKESTIGDLYAIRAGLSYISDLSDQYKKKNNSIPDLNKKIGEKHDKINRTQKMISEQRGKEAKLRAEHDVACRSLELKKANKMKEKDEFDRKRKKELKDAGKIDDKGLIVRLCISWAIFIFWIVCAILEYDETPLWMIIVVLLAFCIWPIICLAKFIAMMHKVNSKKRKVKKSQKKTKDSFEKNFTKECKNKEDNINNLKRMADYAMLHTDEIVEGYQNEIQEDEQGIKQVQAEIAECKAEIDDLRSKAKQVYKGLEKSYAGFCHPDNWKHIDRILYYLVTGRADNLRDALNLMDRRMDAEMIASELRATSQMISGEIRRASSSISHSVALGAERICDATSIAADRISKSNDRVAAGLAESNALASANLAATSRLVSAQQLNNSLQRKANASMDELLRDYQVVNNRVHY